ncbi:Uncharacterised protein [Chlamydia trachomatis]|nr:Uncharacterised protein [Chlamydia trachomatis]
MSNIVSHVSKCIKFVHFGTLIATIRLNSHSLLATMFLANKVTVCKSVLSETPTTNVSLL